MQIKCIILAVFIAAGVAREADEIYRLRGARDDPLGEP